MRRRTMLTGVAGVVTVGLAGCTGGDSSGTSGSGQQTTAAVTPSADDSPRELMPAEGDQFTRESISERGPATLSGPGAEAGVGAMYYTEDDIQYTAAVYRFPSADAVEEGLSHWTESAGGDPKVYVPVNNFAVMVFGPDLATAYVIAGNSPTLTETTARENNLMNTE